MIELLSIDLADYCSKQCSFCYNHSTRDGNVMWKPQEVISFCADCIRNGIKAVSLGGGEPFEYEGVFEVIDALYPMCYLSITTNGLPLMKEETWAMLMLHKPDKVHVTIHNPDDLNEVDRVMAQVEDLGAAGIKPGVNLLVGADKVEAAGVVYGRLNEILCADQVIVIPQRFSNTPSPRQLSMVAGGKPFQSPSCLLGCKRPSDFVSVSWDKKVNSCSYASGKESLSTLDFEGLTDALERVNWKSCRRSV